jgi:hypothetical protein
MIGGMCDTDGFDMFRVRFLISEKLSAKLKRADHKTRQPAKRLPRTAERDPRKRVGGPCFPVL